MARIAFDLDGTLVGWSPKEGRLAPSLRPGILRVLRRLHDQGHTLILWTFAARAWWFQVRAMFPQLRGVFAEVYTRDDTPPHWTQGRGVAEPVKDIRRIAADVLVDNEPAHHEWARRHGLEGQYVLVSTFGV